MKLVDSNRDCGCVSCYSQLSRPVPTIHLFGFTNNINKMTEIASAYDRGRVAQPSHGFPPAGLAYYIASGIRKSGFPMRDFRKCLTGPAHAVYMGACYGDRERHFYLIAAALEITTKKACATPNRGPKTRGFRQPRKDAHHERQRALDCNLTG